MRRNKVAIQDIEQIEYRSGMLEPGMPITDLVEITFFNRAIALAFSDNEKFRRIHRVLETIGAPRIIRKATPRTATKSGDRK